MTQGSGRDYDMLVQPHRVHRSIYTDPEIFQEELDKVFGGTWVFLAHESEIPKANDYKTTTVGQRPVIVTRSASGEINAVLNRCMHRGVEVCGGGLGNARTFSCPYHGWTYDNAGRLLTVPFPRGVSDEHDPCKELSLLALPRIESFRGFIWGSLNPDVPKLHEYLGNAADLLDAWVDRSPTGEIELGRVPRRIEFKANWKVWWDAAADGLHPNFVHRSLLEMTTERHGKGRSLSHFSRDPNLTDMFNRDLPHGHQFLDQRPALVPRLSDHARPMPGDDAAFAAIESRLGPEEHQSSRDLTPGMGMNLSIFPNLGLVTNQVGVIRPIAYDQTEVCWYSTRLVGVPDEVNTVRMRVAEDFPNFGDPDDVEMWEAVQRGLETVPEAEWYDTSRGLGLDHATTSGGSTTVPVTDELPTRATHQEWKRLMSARSGVRR